MTRWLLLCSLIWAPLAAAVDLPAPGGPYPVGMQRFELTDPARHGVVSRNTDEPRVLPGYVWYPAAHGTRGTRPYLTRPEVETQGRAMARNFTYGADDLSGLDQVRAHSVEGAAP